MEEKDFPISAYLSNPGSSDGWWVGFPTNKEELQTALKHLGSESGRVDVQYYSTGESELCNRLPKKLNAENLDELNFIAVRLDEMSESDRDIFDAVVEAEWHCESLSDIINICENLEKFDLQPAYSAEEYGAFHINLARDEYADAMNNLEVSQNPQERDFFSYVADIESYVDLAAYGRLQAEREDGAFTEQGYLTKVGAFEEVYRGHHDLPDDFRVYEAPEITASDHDFIIRAVYTYAGADNERISETVDFPAPAERIAELLSNAGINGSDERVFFAPSYESKLYGLSQVLDAIEDGVHPSELNDLAAKLDGLSEREQRLFTSALEMHRYGGDMEGLLNFASRLAPEEAPERKSFEKESVLTKIRDAMALPKQPHKPKSQDKSGPEL